MATNPGFEFQRAEEEYRAADTPEDKLKKLQRMLRTAPKHKSSGNLLASIKERIAKLKKSIDKQKRPKGSGYSPTIKREGAAQICIVGTTNTGKSTLLHALTGANVAIAAYEFTTKHPEIGTLDHEGVKLQLVEIPAIVEQFEDSAMGPTYLSIMEHADLLILLFNTPKEKTLLDKELTDITTKRIIYNNETKKVFAKKVWKRLPLIKVCTKQPGRERDLPPISFPKGTTVRDVAKKVHKDFLKSFKYARIKGTSAKFLWQTVGLDHTLADDDVVELHLH